MTDELTFDQLEARVAQTSATLLQTVLQIARSRAEDQETADTLDALTMCQLIITATGSQVQHELLAVDDSGKTRRVSIGLFEEVGVLQ